MAKTTKKNVKTTARKTNVKAKKATPKVAPKPPTPRTLTPYLAVNDAAAAIEWYKKAFGAKETSRQPGPMNKIMHASLRIGDSDIFLADIFPGSESVDATRSGTPVTITVYSKNNDKLFKSAADNGAKVTMPLANQFWGDRYGQLRDPFGHMWAFNYPAKMTAAEKETLRVEAMKQMGAPPQ